jgi:hypothetical protein
MEALAGSTTITGLNLTGWVPVTIPESQNILQLYCDGKTILLKPYFKILL